MKKRFFFFFSIFIILLFGAVACGKSHSMEVQASLDVVEAINRAEQSCFAQAIEPRTFHFPDDHGPHAEYETEWWYYTGNMHTKEGRPFGFQLTFFRRGIECAEQLRESHWASRNIYMAHLAVSDISDNAFFVSDRFSRDGAGLAGASGDPYHVFLEDWSATGEGDAGMHLLAHAGDIGLDLLLEQAKPAVLQGDAGLSQKGSRPGNASYYYSLTRLQTQGTITVKGQPYTVTGLSWMDHEFGTSALEQDALGWDWFSLQLDNGYDVMVWQIRTANDHQADDTVLSPPFLADGTLVDSDGTSQRLDMQDIALEVGDRWQSPHTGIVYPAQWHLSVPEEEISLAVIPHLADQELLTTIVYWEGAVRVNGMFRGQPVTGNGYVELTGYGE